MLARMSRAPRPWKLAAAGFIGVFAAVSALVLTLEDTARHSARLRRSIGIPDLLYTAEHNKLLMAGVCGATAIGLLGWVLLSSYRARLARRLHRLALGVLLVLLVAGSFAYFYGIRGVVLTHFTKFHDTYHYVLGPKYFPELGYFDLYDCTLVADRELGRPVVPSRARIRDLRTYRYERASHLLKDTPCHERFSAERWRDFKQDIDFFRDHTGRFLIEIMHDRGYNGTPFHTAVAMPLVNAVELTYPTLSRLALIDVFAITAMFVCVARAFGNVTALLFALFALTNFGDRYELIGGSYLRYLWYATLGIGIAMLQLRRYATAGVCLAAAAMLNVFPLLFFGGIGLKVALAIVRRRPVLPEHRRFIKAALATAVVAAALSVSHSHGLANYSELKRDMDLHAGVVSTGRIGFRYAFMFRGEVTEDDPRVSNRQKAEEFDRPALQIPYWVLTALVLGFGAVVASRLDDVAATCLTGVLGFFMLFGAVPYYYAILAFLVLLWHGSPTRRLALSMTAVWFLASLAVHVGWLWTDFRPFVQSGLMTWTTGGYLLLCLAVLARISRGLAQSSCKQSALQGIGEGGNAR